MRKHFIDDRLDTLVAVQQASDLADWRLYLADWWVTVRGVQGRGCDDGGALKMQGHKQRQEDRKWVCDY